MAFGYRTVGSFVASPGSTITVNTPPSIGTGDIALVFYGGKPYDSRLTISDDWLDIGSAINGSVAAGTDTGSMQMRCWYRIWNTSVSDPVIVSNSYNVCGAIMIVFQTEDDTYEWVTPEGYGAGDNTSGTAFKANITDFTGMDATDMIVGYAAMRSDSATQSSITFSGQSNVFNKVTVPRAELITTLGGDMEMGGGYAFCTTGGSYTIVPFNYSAVLGGSYDGTAFAVRLRQTLKPDNPFPYIHGGYYG